MDVAFPWETLKAVIGGSSAVDVHRLQLDSMDKATEFLDSYGYRWTQQGDRLRLDALRGEAIAFLEDLVVDERGLCLPEAMREDTDVRALLVFASVAHGSAQAWRCALLRVMHVLAHVETYLSRRFATAIHDQIVSRFQRHIVSTAAGLSLGSGPGALPVAAFEVKHAKSRWSAAIKLLHKDDNVAAQVFDRIGVRIVTQERFDALRAVRYLREHDVFNFANVKPSRSHNTLIDIEQVRRKSAELVATMGDASEPERLDAMHRFVRGQPLPRASSDPVNRFSGIDYHAIQFTCRQLIRMPDDPLTRFFFPFEVQIMDEEAMAISRRGLASHDAYKARQRAEAKRRVLGRLLDASRVDEVETVDMMTW